MPPRSRISDKPPRLKPNGFIRGLRSSHICKDRYIQRRKASPKHQGAQGKPGRDTTDPKEQKRATIYIPNVYSSPTNTRKNLTLFQDATKTNKNLIPGDMNAPHSQWNCSLLKENKFGRQPTPVRESKAAGTRSQT